MGEDWSTSDNESEYSGHSSDTVDLNFCDGKDIRFIRTLFWDSRSKREREREKESEREGERERESC